MPRRGQIDPTGYYHVSTRGNFGQPLFLTPAEHELYLDLYGRHARKHRWTTLAWALLWNHHHFLIKLTEGGLSEGMRAINHGFSRRLNAVYGRTGTGHLVRHCFFAGLIETEEHLGQAIRYIDLNAVAARRCRHPDEWPWSSYRATIGHAPPRPFHDVSATLAHFGSSHEAARVAYQAFVRERFPGNGYETPPEARHVVRSAA